MEIRLWFCSGGIHKSDNGDIKILSSSLSPPTPLFVESVDLVETALKFVA